jgi:hypothetical protein
MKGGAMTIRNQNLIDIIKKGGFTPSLLGVTAWFQNELVKVIAVLNQEVEIEVVRDGRRDSIGE